MWTDSNTAEAVASRRGLGETRNIELRLLWVQQKTHSGRVEIRRVPRELNLAHQLTTGKAWHEIQKLVRGVGEEDVEVVDRTGQSQANRDGGRTCGKVDALLAPTSCDLLR